MKNEYRQVVKLATPGELRAYVVFEHQLDVLAQGSPVSLLLNFSLFFLGVAATSLGTIASAPPAQDRIYYTFLIIFLITLIAGVVLLAVWYSMHRSVTSLIVEIKAQMPANPEIEQAAPGHPEALGQELHTSRGSGIPPA